MNERIRELAKEARLIQAKDFKSGDEVKNIVFGDGLEKFAELIVRECAKIADDGCGSACFGLGINGAMLLQHFGVEE